MEQFKLLGIVPARSGSKGIPGKNMELLGNKPLLLHAIDSAIAANICDKLVLSTDDEKMKQCALTRKEVSVPFLRPEHLASDSALIADCILHLLHYLKTTENYEPDAFMLLEPTSPLRRAQDLQEALDTFKASGKGSLISLSPPQQHPSNMIYHTLTGWQHCVERKPQSAGRQDFHQTWFINGAVYITDTETFLQTKKVYELSDCAFYFMPDDRGIDINTTLDLKFARALININCKEEDYATI